MCADPVRVTKQTNGACNQMSNDPINAWLHGLMVYGDAH